MANRDDFRYRVIWSRDLDEMEECVNRMIQGGGTSQGEDIWQPIGGIAIVKSPHPDSSRVEFYQAMYRRK